MATYILGGDKWVVVRMCVSIPRQIGFIAKEMDR
jgi:hypothetical protein